MPLNFLSGVGKFDPESLTESQKASRFKIKVPSSQQRNRSYSDLTTSTVPLTDDSDSDDEDKDEDPNLVLFFKKCLEFRNHDYAKLSRGMTKKALDKFKISGEFDNEYINEQVQGLINDCLYLSKNLKGTDEEKKNIIIDLLVEIIRKRYNNNLIYKHPDKLFTRGLLGGKRKTAKKQRKTRKSKKSKRSTRKHK